MCWWFDLRYFYSNTYIVTFFLKEVQCIITKWFMKRCSRRFFSSEWMCMSNFSTLYWEDCNVNINVGNLSHKKIKHYYKYEWRISQFISAISSIYTPATDLLWIVKEYNKFVGSVPWHFFFIKWFFYL